MNLRSGMTFSSASMSMPADHRREPPVLELHNHGPLHIRRGRDYARRVANLHREVAPIRQDIFRADENVGIEIDHLLPQFAIESGHDGDHEDEHGHAEHHAADGDEGDDGKKSALRFEITKREEKTERQFQIADTVAVFLAVFQQRKSSAVCCDQPRGARRISNRKHCVFGGLCLIRISRHGNRTGST